MQIGTGLPLAVVFLTLPKAYEGRFSGAALLERPVAWGLSGGGGVEDQRFALRHAVGDDNRCTPQAVAMAALMALLRGRLAVRTCPGTPYSCYLQFPALRYPAACASASVLNAT